MNRSTFAILLSFLCMGFGDAAGQLVSIVEQAFGVTPFMASFVSLAGMVMFGLLSVPAGVWQSKIGKKRMLIVGLLLFLVGAILPVLAFSFPVILAAVLFMGAGATILQVSANPLMRDVSAPGKYSSNLSFAQAVKAVGTLSTSLIVTLIGTSLLHYRWFTITSVATGQPINAGFRLLFPIFAAVLLLTLFFVMGIKARTNAHEQAPTTLRNCLSALKNPYILMMFLGIFFYCGAEASMFNRIPSVLAQGNPGVTPAMGNIILIVALFVGRLLGGVFLRYIKPKLFIFITLAISLAGNIMLFAPYSGVLTWTSFILIGVGFANIFPLIFSMCVDRHPEQSNEIAGLMTTAIVGAAIVPLITGAAANVNLKYAFIVTLGCLAYLFFVAVGNLKSTRATT